MTFDEYSAGILSGISKALSAPQVKILHQENNFVEYLGKPFGATSSYRRIKEYALQVIGLSI